MEEGLEPHEVIERTAEQRHHIHAKPQSPATISAITAAILAVLAAAGSLLSGHAANQAILKQSQASDQWAYYQAKSTKGHLYEVGREIVTVLSRTSGESKPPVERFEQQMSKYEQEREQIKKKAEELQNESQHEFGQHHYYSLGIASFQVGIVLASISILISHRAAWWLSLVSGLVGVLFLFQGLFLAH
jgi:gas vesicle protein